MARIRDAKRAPGVFAACLLAASRGEETTDAEAGFYVLADALLRLRASVLPKGHKD